MLGIPGLGNDHHPSSSPLPSHSSASQAQITDSLSSSTSPTLSSSLSTHFLSSVTPHPNQSFPQTQPDIERPASQYTTTVYESFIPPAAPAVVTTQTDIDVVVITHTPSTLDPDPTSSSSPSLSSITIASPSSPRQSLSMGAIVGITAAASILIAIIGTILVLRFLRRRRENTTQAMLRVESGAENEHETLGIDPTNSDQTTPPAARLLARPASPDASFVTDKSSWNAHGSVPRAGMGGNQMYAADGGVRLAGGRPGSEVGIAPSQENGEDTDDAGSDESACSILPPPYSQVPA
ncbi:hypothetical protein C8Q76DRAFT_799572 [Earliella scabrosa]|nr:hypothetical protein C8Q76DRAFT_799572 [Earliella scabrosa]